MDKSLEKLSEKLATYISNLKELNKEGVGKKITGRFPNKKELKENNEVHINIIIEQGEKLLNLSQNSTLFGLEFHYDDKAVLMEQFISDIKLFATMKNIHLGGRFILLLGQSKIPEHAFFHLAASSLLPNTYKTIEQNAGKVFDTYSIPFKIRVAIENKIKSIIGFKSLAIIKNNGDKINSNEFPFAGVINELISTNCLKLPCSLKDVKNIYQWGCEFCHTGEKEPVWLSMKALEIIALLFIYEYQEKNTINVRELWGHEEDVKNKLAKYEGVVKPLFYFKEEWSVQKLQDHLNKDDIQKKICKMRGIKEIKFNLSETELSGVSAYFCERTKKLY